MQVDRSLQFKLCTKKTQYNVCKTKTLYAKMLRKLDQPMYGHNVTANKLMT